jgi:hypothetical protein
MTKEPTHLAAGNGLKSKILPCGVLSEAAPGEAQQFIVRLRNPDPLGRFEPRPNGLRTIAESKSGLEDDVVLLMAQTIEKAGALANWAVWIVAGNPVDNTGWRLRSAGRYFTMARHHAAFSVRERLLRKFLSSPTSRPIPEHG